MSRFGALLAMFLLAISPVALVAGGSFAPANAQVSESVQFRTALEPYGQWQRHSRWGDVWIPAQRTRDWRPYTVGRWVYTDEWGWYWASDPAEADWGWITYHYGRWIFDRELRWIWIAGKEWGPGWVQWRRGTQYVGWAPLPADEIVAEYRDEPDVWIFVRGRDFIAPRLSVVVLPVRDQSVYIRDSVVVNRTVVIRERGIAVNPGIPPAVVAAVVGRQLRSYDVRPRVLAGTGQIQGAVVVRPDDVRRRRSGAAQVTVRETRTVIKPAERVPEPQPLAAGAEGHLGDTPPRAARGTAQQGAPSTQEQPQQEPQRRQEPQQKQEPQPQQKQEPQRKQEPQPQQKQEPQRKQEPPAEAGAAAQAGAAAPAEAGAAAQAGAAAPAEAGAAAQAGATAQARAATETGRTEVDTGASVRRPIRPIKHAKSPELPGSVAGDLRADGIFTYGWNFSDWRMTTMNEDGKAIRRVIER